MEDQVQEIKQKTDIVSLINMYVPLKKRGRHWMACCPFHQEKSPSFVVSPELQIYKCFGCGKSGDVFSFLQEYEKLDFKEALAELAKRAGIKLVRRVSEGETENNRQNLLALNQKLSDFYKYVLLRHDYGKEALIYLESRGISIETIKKFGLGFAPRLNKSTINYLYKQGFTKKQLMESGTFGESWGRVYDRFSGRLVFPLFDFRGRILGFSGRILPSNRSENQAKYINSPETILYHKSNNVYGLNFAKDAIRKKDKVLVVEGEFDMISPYQIGIENVVAIKGTAFTAEQLQLLLRYSNNLVLGLDGDFAGSNAMLKSILLAESLGFEMSVLCLEPYKDPDEAIRSDVDFFKKQLEQTKPVWDFVIETAVSKNPGMGARQKKDILNQTLPYLQQIKNPVVKKDYMKKLAFELGTEVELIEAEASRSGILKQENETVAIKKNEEKNSKETVLLSWILNTKSPAGVFEKLRKQLPKLEDRQLDTIYQLLPDFVNARDFAKKIPAEAGLIYTQLYLEGEKNSMDSKTRAQEIHQLANRLIGENLKKRINQITAEIGRLENRDMDVSKLEEEYSDLINRLSKIQN